MVLLYTVYHLRNTRPFYLGIYLRETVQGPDNNDPRTCRYFAKGFNSPQEMTHCAFYVIASAKTNQRTTDELLLLYHNKKLFSKILN
jgi:hypothetical protein